MTITNDVLDYIAPIDYDDYESELATIEAIELSIKIELSIVDNDTCN